MSKVDVCRERFADLFMVRKLFPVVSGNGMNNILKGPKQRNSGQSDIGRALAVDLCRDGKVRHPLYDGH